MEQHEVSPHIVISSLSASTCTYAAKIFRHIAAQKITRLYNITQRESSFNLDCSVSYSAKGYTSQSR